MACRALPTQPIIGGRSRGKKCPGQTTSLATSGGGRRSSKSCRVRRSARISLIRTRADFQHLWNMPPASAILDIGAGWGAIASALGGEFKRVVAVEGVLERAKFIQTRVGQLGLENVTPICASFTRLPLGHGQFDAIVLNGVVEWVPLATLSGDPRQIQLDFLRRVRQLLKPRGLVCVGIENRVGWALLRGAPDHSGLPYTSMMPRRLAAIWCRRRSDAYRSDANVGYRTYTYSLPGYRKLFSEAGFTKVEVYHAWNGYNKPTVLLPLADDRALRAFYRRRTTTSSLRNVVKRAAADVTARTGLWQYLASEYVFILTCD